MGNKHDKPLLLQNPSKINKKIVYTAFLEHTEICEQKHKNKIENFKKQ